jgi:hypothetical protein
MAQRAYTLLDGQVVLKVLRDQQAAEVEVQEQSEADSHVVRAVKSQVQEQVEVDFA